MIKKEKPFAEEFDKVEEFQRLKRFLGNERKIVKELISLSDYTGQTKDVEEKRIIYSQINSLKRSLEKTNKRVEKELSGIFINKKLTKTSAPQPAKKEQKKEIKKEQTTSKVKVKDFGFALTEIEEDTLGRLKKKEKEEKAQKIRKPSSYVKTANKMFSKFSLSLIQKGMFRGLKRNLVKSNMRFLPASYVSVILFASLITLGIGFLTAVFFLFFNLSPLLPIITLSTESLVSRFIKVFWVVLAFPLATFGFMYFYPSLERKSQEGKINFELPFVAIHMSAIAGSLIEPSKIFDIVVKTKEYPHTGKEFIKLLNEINVYGADLVTALRSIAFNSPSSKLAELLNGVATTITSGGNLQDFFDKRSQTLLFDHRIEREKYSKTAETFMDLYISVVIAAPMILMLLVMMMKISGLGVQLSTAAITIIMILVVTGINIMFLVFLQLKQPTA